MNSNRLKWAAAVLGAVLAAALMLGAVGLNTAAAQGEPDEAVAEVAASRPQPGDMMTTVLQPGDNLVGWIEGTTPVAELFDAVAEIETVWAWDALRRQWSAASRRVPSELHTLRTLESGMGLLVQVGGNEPVEWLRSAYPARGLVELYPGDNLVAWSGRDGSAMDYLALGIGSSLVEAWVWDVERSGHRLYNSANPESAEGLQAFDRGDAVWINVSHAVNWLQPTGVLPTMQFLDGGSENSLTAQRAYLASVIDFFAARYGIAADHSRLTVLTGYVADGSPGKPRGRAGYSNIYASVAPSCFDIVDERCRDSQVSLLIHEYFHTLQNQLADDNGGYGTQLVDYPNAFWLDEGSAERMVYLYSPFLRSPATVPVPHVTGDPFTAANALIEARYDAGFYGANFLASHAGDESIVEFYRKLATVPNGPQSHWQQRPSWKATFRDVFGLTVDEFFVAFHSELQQILATGPERIFVSGDSTGKRLVRGTLVDAHDSAIYGAEVMLHGVVATKLTAGRTGPGGEFELGVPTYAEQEGIVLEITQGSTCSLFYGSDGLAPHRANASPITLSGDVTDVPIRLPEDPCVVVRGRVVDDQQRGIANVRVSRSPGGYQMVHTTVDGDFSYEASRLSVEKNEPQVLYVMLSDHCHAIARLYGTSTMGVQTSWIGVTDGDGGIIQIKIQSDVCNRQIRGHLVGADVNEFRGSFVEAVDISGRSGVAWIESDGSFAISVSKSDGYRLRLWSGSGWTCWMYLYYVDGDPATTSQGNASLIRVAEGDVSGVVFRASENPCG